MKDLRVWAQESYAVIDLEATGPLSNHNYVIDVGIVRVEKGKIVKTYQSLVKPPVPVPPSITRLTGIRDEDLVGAPTFKDIIDEIDAFLGGSIFTAHNAPFDYGFLNLEYLRNNRKLLKSVLCTKNLVHEVLPDLPKLGLDALMEHFDITASDRHRAFPDAQITAEVLLKLFKAKNINQSIEKVLIPVEENPIQIPDEIFSGDLSDEPGVYRMLDEKGSVLYVGSAENIKARTLIHFLAQIESKKERELCRKTVKVETSLFPTELEAKIQEAKDIRAIKPKYNRLLKNWYPGSYFWISKEDFPQIVIENEPTESSQYVCLGPFKSRKLLERLVELAKVNFRLCDFRIGKQRRPRRYPGRKSCSGVRIKRCAGACLGKVPAKTYQKQVADVVQFLKMGLSDGCLENKNFLKIINSKESEKILGGWKPKRILKRLLKENALCEENKKRTLVLEEISLDNTKTMFLIHDGLLVKSWVVDDEVSESVLKEEIEEILKKNRRQKKDPESVIEELVVEDYLSTSRAYRRIVSLPLNKRKSKQSKSNLKREE